MYCGKCGTYVMPSNNFCSRCGMPASTNFVGRKLEDYYVIKSIGSAVDYSNHGELISLFSRTKDSLVLFDMAKVEFIDSTGIGGLVTIVYKTNQTKQEVKFIIRSQNIMKTIKASGMDNVLEIYESENEARASWGLTVI